MFQTDQIHSEHEYQSRQAALLEAEKEKFKFFLNDYDNVLKQVDQAVIEDNIDQLRKLAYQYLNLAKDLSLRYDIRNDLYPLLFQTPEDLIEVGKRKQVASILKNLLARSKENVVKKLADHDADSKDGLVRPSHWNPTGQLPIEKRIKVIHGGGLQYITNFLQGKETGYKLEKPGRGIQVHPYENELSEAVKNRVREYAVDRSISSCDFPAILEAEVAVGFLDSAPNTYEAGIRGCYVSCLSNVKITILLPSTVPPSRALVQELISSQEYRCSTLTWEIPFPGFSRLKEYEEYNQILQEMSILVHHALPETESVPIEHLFYYNAVTSRDKQTKNEIGNAEEPEKTIDRICSQQF